MCVKMWDLNLSSENSKKVIPLLMSSMEWLQKHLPLKWSFIGIIFWSICCQSWKTGRIVGKKVKSLIVNIILTGAR